MKKLFLSLSLSLAVLLSGGAIASAETPVELMINNTRIKVPYPIFIEKDTTLLPLRFFSEKLNAKVGYLPDTDTAYIDLGDKTITINAREGVGYIDGLGYSLKGLIKKYDDRLYVPLRFLGQMSGAKIDWDASTRTISIVTSVSEKDKAEEATQEIAKNARVLWQAQLERPITSDILATADGKLYVPNGHILTAMDSQGNVLWSNALGGYDPRGQNEQVLGTPIQQGNTLFLGTADYQKGAVDFTQSVFSINTDGKLNWSFDTSSNYTGASGDKPSTPAISTKNNFIYVRDKEGVLCYTLEPSQRWRFAGIDKEIPLSPLVVNRNEQADDVVLIDQVNQGTIYILNSDREEEWSYPIQMGTPTDMAYDISSRRLFVALKDTTTTGGAAVLSLDLLTNSWKYQSYLTETNIIKMQPVKGELYVATGDKFYKIESKGSVKTYREQFTGIVDFHVDHQGAITALYNDGTIKKFVNDELSWETSIKGATKLSVTPSGTAIVTTNDNRVIAVDTK